MRKEIRKKISIGIAVMLFGVLGMVGSSTAATVTLPEPTKYYANNTYFGTTHDPVLQHYVAWAHDDFWSYGARMIANDQARNPSTYFPTGTYGFYNINTGTGNLGIIVQDQSGHDNPLTFPDAIKEQGTSSAYHDVWGLGGQGGLAVDGTTNSLAIHRGAAGQPTVTVADILNYLHTPADGANHNTPVFGLDMQLPQDVGYLDFSGRVYLADPDTGLIYVDPNTGVKALWAFDIIAQGTGNSGSQRGSSGDPDFDWPGFSQNGNYDPTSYAQAIAFPGGGSIDYLAYAPTMDLSKYSPDLLFVTDFTFTAPGTSNIGKNEVFILQDVAFVPEPATLMLLGLGLVGLAGVRRKFKK